MSKTISDGGRCIVTEKDSSILIITITFFVTFLVYGANFGALGAAVPYLATAYDKSESDFGFAFTCRGIGFMVGTFAAAYLLNKKEIHPWLVLIVSILMALSGCLCLVFALQMDFTFFLIAIGIQSFCFAIVETSCNFFLPEMWQARVQPWMQAMHACFAIGAIVGPALVGIYGYSLAYILLATCSSAPLIGISTYYLYSVGKQKVDHTPTDLYSPLHNNEIVSKEVMTETETEPDNNEEDLVKSDHDSFILAPLNIRIILTIFLYIYVGNETGFGGWIPTYALSNGVTNSESEAAFLTSLFWAAITAGRGVSIITSNFYNSVTLLRIQLAISLIGSLMLLKVPDGSYSYAILSSMILGYGYSSIFPMIYTLVNEYRFKMNSDTTALYTIGWTSGEATVPICIGLVVSSCGSYSLPLTMIAGSSMMVILYGIVHVVANYKTVQSMDDKFNLLNNSSNVIERGSE